MGLMWVKKKNNKYNKVGGGGKLKEDLMIMFKNLLVKVAEKGRKGGGERNP